MKTLQWCLAPPKQRFMSRTRNHSVVGMGVGDVLLFKIETEEYVFEQWDLSGSIPNETGPKARAN